MDKDYIGPGLYSNVITDLKRRVDILEERVENLNKTATDFLPNNILKERNENDVLDEPVFVLFLTKYCKHSLNAKCQWDLARNNLSANFKSDCKFIFIEKYDNFEKYNIKFTPTIRYYYEGLISDRFMPFIDKLTASSLVNFAIKCSNYMF